MNNKNREWDTIEKELNDKMKDAFELMEGYEEEMEDVLMNQESQQQEYRGDINYYKEFWRYYILNEMAIKKVNELHNLNSKLGHLSDDISKLQQELQISLSNRHKKKNRRTSQEIEKSFQCPYESCNKQYGSDVSLNLHIKIKHDGGNKTDREKFAVYKKMIIEAQMNNDPIPDLQINFPPGYLEQFKKQFLEHINKDENN